MIRIPGVSRPRYYASLSNKDKNETVASKINNQQQIVNALLKIQSLCCTLLEASDDLHEEKFSVIAWSQFKGSLQQAQSHLQAIEKIVDPTRKYEDPLRSATLANRVIFNQQPIVDIGPVPDSLYKDTPYETNNLKRVRFTAPAPQEEDDNEAKKFEEWVNSWNTTQWEDDMKSRGDVVP
jgi:hypothetical protein